MKRKFKKINFLILFSIFFFKILVLYSQTQTETFTSSGVFTVPAGVTSITVECWGGGGAGGGTKVNRAKGGGGGAGGTYASSVLSVTPGTSYNYTVATAVNGRRTDGLTGNPSWFGSVTTVYAEGGEGGSAPNGGISNGGIGSTANSYGDILIAGSNGLNGNTTQSGAGGTGANGGGTGGTAISSSGGNGNPGTAPGGGGSGAFVNNNTNRRGGNGSDGLVKVTYNCVSYSITGVSVSGAVYQNNTATVTLTSNPSDLPIGTYNVSYSLSGANTLSGSATMVVNTAGVGTFVTSILPNAGSTDITITALSSGLCVSPISINNTTTFNVLLSYCSASGYYPDEYISRVQFGSLDNSSGASTYSDYTSLYSSLIIGTGTNITVTNGRPYNGDVCGIWIDWNQDGDFDDANETISVSGSPGKGPYTSNIIPPAGAATGFTRMRIRITWYTTPNDCGTQLWGEVEDYSVYVVPQGASTITAGSGTVTTTIPSTTDTKAEATLLNFDFTVNDDGSTPSTDNKPTLFNTLEIFQGTGNDITNWADAIGGAILTDGVNSQSVNVQIFSNLIKFTSIDTASGKLGYIADNQSKTYTLHIWLKNNLGVTLPSIIDGLNFVFDVNNKSFIFTNNSSFLATSQQQNSGATDNEVTVDATELRFITQPSSSASSGVVLSQQPIIWATDVNGNLDKDINTTVTLSNTGSLTMSGNSLALNNGIADFGNPNTFMFTTGGKYVMLNATDGTISTLVPSSEIAVDIVGCELFYENFDSYSVSSDLPSNPSGWEYIEMTNSPNDWGIATVSGANKCLTIYNNNTSYQYANNDGQEIAYYTTKIDARQFKDVTIDLTWQSYGETDYDYGNIVWSTDGINWSVANSKKFQDQSSWISETYDISSVDGQEFYIGFMWRNDGGTNNNPPFAIDNILIKGFPNMEYNFSYRQDVYQSIVGTIVEPDANDGVNISLPAGFNFSYDGTIVTNVRANLNGWLQIGTSHNLNAVNNNLTSTSETPFLAPLWDSLASDNQTKILYNVTGNAPTRVFTVEWLDVLWGNKRENFQVKLYETSGIIEFWYGKMNSNPSGSASIGINDVGSCMNKMISITPAETPISSYTAENPNIKDATFLNEGLVYIFNPLIMQKYRTWESATVLIGQPDWNAQNNTVDQSTTSSPSCAAISSKNVLAVGQQGVGLNPPMTNGRILIWNSTPTTNGAPADVVVGKNDFTDVNGGCTQSIVNSINGVCFSPDGNKLIGVDYGNNRVLIWDSIPTTNGQPADVVIGQPDFTSNSPGCDTTKLNGPLDAFVLPNGKLLISDAGNNRVLIYNKIPTQNGAAADVVIGQNNFLSNSAGAGANGLNGPWGISYSPEGDLFIVDQLNNRILVYHDIPSTNGTPADQVIGQTDFTTTTSGTSKNLFNVPLGVTISPEGKMAICEFYNHRTLIFNRVPSFNGGEADYVLGQPDFDEAYTFNDGLSQTDMTTPDDRNMEYTYATRFDLNGRLLVVGRNMRRVMLYGETPTLTSDLEVSIKADAPDYCVYSEVKYSVECINNGPSDAYNVTVNAQVPNGMINKSYQAQDGSTYNQKSGYWRIPYIKSGDTARLNFYGEVQEDLAGESNVVAYCYTIASSQKDNDFSNNSSTAVVAIRSYYAPTISDITDQYIARNSHSLVPFTVDDKDGLSDIDTYTITSTDTLLLPVDYTSNFVFGGIEPNKTLDIIPEPNKYGYSSITLTVTDKHGCYSKDDFNVTVGNFWEGDDYGNDPTDWDDINNWSAQIPNDTTEAIIPTRPIGGYFPVIDVNDAKCYDLVVEPKASVTLNDGYPFKVFNNIYLQSDQLGTGSFVDYNSSGDSVDVLNTIIVERYVSPDRWEYLSSPLSNMPNTALTENNCDSSYNGNLIYYDETYNSDNDGNGIIDWFDGWQWPWYYNHNSDPLEPAKGYAYYSFYQCQRTINFTGNSQKFNTGHITIKLYNEDDTAHTVGGSLERGWNLVGNPYPSGLNADEFLSANNSVIDQTIYMWDEAGASGFNSEGMDYASYNPFLGATTGSGSGNITPDKYISISQGFFVHRTNTDISGTDLVFENSMRETENSAFFSISKNTIGKIKLAMHDDVNYNEIIVGLAPDATFDINSKYDGYKIEGNAHLSFYSIKNNRYFVNQALPDFDSISRLEIPLGFKTDSAGDYQINLKYMENIPENIKAYLIDKYNSDTINLYKQKNYTFYVDEGTRFNDRFIILLYQNNKPEVVNLIDTLYVLEDQTLSSVLPDSVFYDPDNDPLTYKLKMSDNMDLTNWMSFDESTLQFNASPANENVGVYNLVFTATDPNNESASLPLVLKVINVNDAPILQYPLPDTTIYANIAWSYQIPLNTFTDIDLGDSLLFTANFNVNEDLPVWINFNKDEHTFYAYPTNNDCGSYIISVNATDLSNATTFTSFLLNVVSSQNIKDINNDFVVYPNPNNGKFFIKSNINNYSFSISNVMGQTIYSGLANEKQTKVNLEKIPQGIYLIKIVDKNNAYVIPVTIK